MRRTLLSFVVVFAAAGVSRAEADPPLLLQKPALSKTHIAFGFAGDLWTVGRDGGEAKRLTSGVGLEYGPYYSPDGTQIAFTGEYDGNIDVYLVPAIGGEPKRLTYHPGTDTALGWTPDGKNIVFSSGRTSNSRFNKLFTVRADGHGLPTELPLPMGEEGAVSPDGTRIAYVPFWNRRAVPNSYIAWKQYRGGKASPIWIATLADSRIEKVPREDSNDSCAMWVDGKLYFLSDREGATTTLYCYDPSSKQVKRILENKGFDLLYATAGPDAIVYEQFGSLHTFDPKTGRTKEVKITVTGDFPATRPHYTRVGSRISNATVSPTRARAAFEARGEIFTVPASRGDVRNLTQTPGAFERDPAWSPDGKLLAYFSDESGNYELHLRDPMGTSPARRVTLGEAPNFYFRPVWSPDSKKIAYSDSRMKLWCLDVESGKSTQVDAHVSSGGNAFDECWSPDSKWLTYTKVLDNRLRAAHLYDVAAGKTTQITDGMSDVRYPVFDRTGKYLYFTASTDIGPTTNGIDMSGTDHPVTRSVYLAVLDKTLPSPLAPESDEERGEVQGGGGGGRGGNQGGNQAAATKVDLENLGQRILSLPVPTRNYGRLMAGRAGSVYITEAGGGGGGGGRGGAGGGGGTITRFDLSTRRSETAITGVASFTLTPNADKALYRQGDRWLIGNVNSLAAAAPAAAAPAGGGGGRGRRGGGGGAPAAAPAGDGALNTADMEAYVDPKVEWRQMYHEVWRLERDFLYDPHTHGLNIAATEKRYEPFLEGIRHRADLNYLFNEMLGQIVIGHMYVQGGEGPEVTRVRGGLLGADYKLENGRYRITRLYSGESWNPQTRAPLTQPGVNVKDGDYIIAINGKELRDTDNIDRALEATAGRSVGLKVGPNPDGSGAREVIVVPTDSETALRNLAWIEDNRRKVDKMSGGKVAYVYMPDTGAGGYTSFNRYFFAQVDKDGLVLDERFNGGGKAADYVIDYLRRPLMNYWVAREGKIYTTPGGAIFGPKAMIINEFAGSGGDAMPWYFHQTKLGPLVGKRTWGGLVGIGGTPPLMDGGSVTTPNFAFFSPEGKWDVENHGVAPDVEVELDPYEVRNGRDPQLEKAVELVMEALKKNPLPQPKKPEYPNYHKGDAGKAGGGK